MQSRKRKTKKKDLQKKIENLEHFKNATIQAKSPMQFRYILIKILKWNYWKKKTLNSSTIKLFVHSFMSIGKCVHH